MKEGGIPIRNRSFDFYPVHNGVYDAELPVEIGPGKKRPAKALVLSVYNSLSRHSSFTTEDVRLSHKQVAEELEVSVSTVKRSLKTLEIAGLLLVERENNTVNTYVLVPVPVSKRTQRRRRAPKAGGSQGTAPQPGGGSQGATGGSQGARGSSPGTRASSPKPHKQRRKRHKSNNGKTFVSTEDAPKRNPSGKGNCSAPCAQSPFSDPYKSKVELLERIVGWHRQCGKLTDANYNEEKLRGQLTARILQLGTERARDIYELHALGVNPNVDRFWKQLNAEGEESKKEVPRFLRRHFVKASV